MNYYLLIKREGLDAKGQRLTARQSASVLLEHEGFRVIKRASYF